MSRSPDPQQHLKQSWSQRQRALGNVPQAVLLKNLPVTVNALIDRWHRSVLHWILKEDGDLAEWLLDLGCGYGRMTSTAREAGYSNIIGIDSEPGFCRQYQHDFGYAIRGSIAELPLRAATVGTAYAITAYMYLPPERMRSALKALDACLVPGARVLMLEPGSEFNQLLRSLLPGKRREQLAVPGFSVRQMLVELPPEEWRIIDAGCNLWTTLLLPLLILSARSATITRALNALASRLDAPCSRRRVKGLYRFALHRWVLFEKTSLNS